MAALGLVVLAAGPVRADAIDGTWCFADGRHFTINGPEIVTPGGVRMKGSYDRHGFDYVAPAGEMAAGKRITMDLLDENTVSVRTGAPDAPAVIWHRCTVPRLS